MGATGTTEGLSEAQARTVRALMPIVLGIPDGEAYLVDQAVARFDAFLRCFPEHEKRAADRPRQLITVVRLKCWLEKHAPPEKLTERELRAFVRDFYESDGTWVETILDALTALFGDRIPTVRDLAKSFREMLCLAFYTNPETDPITGYLPVWARDDIWHGRSDVDPADRPEARGHRVHVEAVRARHEHGRPYDPSRLFRGEVGRRVAVIGSGAGGAVAAAHLAKAGYDVAVFESGPRFRPSQYPLDTLEGMSLLFEDGLLTLNRNLDVHLLRGRLVGGGTVLTSGMSIEMRKETLAEWTRMGTGIDADALRRAFRDVEKRIRLREVNPAITTEPPERWRRGGLRIDAHDGEVIYDFEVPRTNVMTFPGQLPMGPVEGLPPIPDRVGGACLACGLCNYGCHFGHKLSTELTYIPDAEAAGAKVHENLPIDHLLGAWDGARGCMRITHVVLGRGQDARVPVDHVVLAAGAVGSPALLLRSAEHDGAFRRLPAFQRDLVGTRLGFNYGTTVVARWDDMPHPSADRGFQIKYVATKSGDQDYVFECAFVPPGLISNVVPGVGKDHRRFMEAYRHLGMAVNTIGSPQHGRVLADRTVLYSVDDREMDTIRRTLASLVRQYLAGDAAEVGLAGIRQRGLFGARFHRDERDWTEADILGRLEQVITHPEHLMLSSAHPQGGLVMNESPDEGAVGADFRLHGVDNLFVTDASIFPSTIVVNPQWSVMSVGAVGAQKALEVMARSGPI